MEDRAEFLFDDDVETRASTKHLPPKFLVTPTYYRDDIEGGNCHPEPHDDFVPLELRGRYDPPTVTFAGHQIFGVIDLENDRELFDLFKSVVADDNIEASVDIIVQFYSDRCWELCRLSSDLVRAILSDDHVDVPVVDREAEFGGVDIAEDVFRDITHEHMKVKDIAKKYEMTYQKIYSWLREVTQCKQLVPLYRKRPKKRLPSYTEVRRLIDDAYKSKGYVASGWNQFVDMLTEKFPYLKSLSKKTVSNKSRRLYGLRSMRPKTSRQGKTVMQQLALESLQGLVLCRMLAGGTSHVLFIDQTSFQYDRRSYKFVGGSGLHPHVITEKSQYVHMYSACDKDGLYAIVFSNSSADSMFSSRFVYDVVSQYRKDKNIDHVYVYVDNVAYQQTRVFRRHVYAAGGCLFYGVRGSPFLNLIEDYFCFIKSHIRQRSPNNPGEYFNAICSGLAVVNHQRSNLILKRLFDNVLERVQKYRNLNRKDGAVPNLRQFRVDRRKLAFSRGDVGGQPSDVNDAARMVENDDDDDDDDPNNDNN